MTENNKKLSRRDFLNRAVVLGMASVGAGAVLTACDKGDKKGGDKMDAKKAGGDKMDAKKAGPLKCDDVAGLSEADKATRTNNQYVEKSTTAGKTCSNCQLYKPGAAGACGSCTLVKGPINPQGYCRVWVKKA
jgi:hypothetical protein